jgi:hypothetical protein
VMEQFNRFRLNRPDSEGRRPSNMMDRGKSPGQNAAGRKTEQNCRKLHDDEPADDNFKTNLLREQNSAFSTLKGVFPSPRMSITLR